MITLRQKSEGKWYSILCNFLDPKYLDKKHHDCPVCCEGKDRFRWTDFNGMGEWICSTCNPDSKSGIDLVMDLNNWDFKEAVTEIEKFLPDAVIAKVVPKKDSRPLLKQIQATLVDGVHVAKYLKNRSLVCHPSIKQARRQYWEDGKKLGDYDCMVCRVVDVDNKPVTYHLTYIEDGVQANVSSPKKIMPPLRSVTGCAIRFGTGIEIGIAEGVETALAARARFKMPVWAALSANGMKNIELPSSVEVVNIFADNDFSFVGQQAAYTLAAKLKRDGLGVVVHVPYEDGTDFADEAENSVDWLASFEL